jgi:hypothetical protein
MAEATPRHGYGRHLIEKALSHTLGVKAGLTFHEDGVGCRIEIPLGRRPGRDLGARTKAEPAGG